MRKNQPVRRGLFTNPPNEATPAISNAIHKLIKGTEEPTQLIKDFDVDIIGSSNTVKSDAIEDAIENTKYTTNEYALEKTIESAKEIEASTKTSPNHILEMHLITTNDTTMENATVDAKDAAQEEASELAMLAKWHTNAEQKVYEAMYSESRLEGSKDWYFTFGQLSEKTKLQNPRTLQGAIRGLIAKGSIEWIEGEPGSHFGKCYRIYEPKEVLERRRKLDIRIHPQSKKIIS